ncbi:MAG: hypothetical protein HKN27_10790 [Silicimonas sp.]|nr:hypothetical protein [Silicimonas sp.]
MSEASVLKRKLAPRLEKALADCAVETLLRKTIPRDADRLCGLDLIVDDVTFSETDKGQLIDALSPQELVYQLSNDKGAGGLCIVSPELLAGLIEVQLYGYVPKTEVVDRKPTRTDGIVVASLVDGWLATAHAVAEREGMEPLPFAGFTRQDGVLDRRNAGLLIEPGRYATATIKMTLGDDAKTGTMCLAWPLQAQSKATPQQFSTQLQMHLVDVKAPMRVVLTRLSLPMERVRDMAVGDVIDVPLEALTSVKLEGIDGTAIGTGRLGQMGGMRAVRLNLDGGSASHPALAAPTVTTEMGAPPNMEELRSLPAMETLPEPAELPDLPPLDMDIGDLPELPDLPEAGGLPDLPGEGDLPELPDLPKLPDLPDL